MAFFKKIASCWRNQKIIRISGKHNISNALAALSAAQILKTPSKVIFKTIASYNKYWRRMEYKGKFRITNPRLEIKVFDNYARHPTEIKAALEAFLEKFPCSKIICVFEPHQSKRLKPLFDNFINSFQIFLFCCRLTK